jgi:hypothetical protein
MKHQVAEFQAAKLAPRLSVFVLEIHFFGTIRPNEVGDIPAEPQWQSKVVVR